MSTLIPYAMKKTIYLSTLFLLVAFTTWAQRQASPTTFVFIDNGPDVNYRYHDGTALLRDGSLLKGRFEYNGRSTFEYRPSGQGQRQRIGLSMIRRLALAGADTLVTTRRDSTVFVRMGTRLYRQLVDGPTLLLDRRFLVDEDRGKIGRDLYVLDADEKWHKFTSLQKLNRWFYGLVEQSGKTLPDVYRNENEIVKAVAQLNGK